MFKARVRASYSFLYSLSGENGFVAAKAKLGVLNSMLYGREVSPYRSKGFKIHYPTLHTSAEEPLSELDEPGKKGAEKPEQTSHSAAENDDWSELGAVAKKKVRLEIPRLFTAKPELFRKPNLKKRPTLRPENNSGKSSSLSIVKNHRLETQVSNSEYDQTKAPDSNDPSSNTHSGKKSASGKVLNASIRKTADGSSCPEINHKSAESKRKVLEVDHNKSKVANPRNQSTEIGIVVGYRIRNLNSETVDSAIHRTCSSYGAVQGLARVDKHVVEALFQVKNASEADFLLEKLNNTAMDECQWSAELQSTMSATQSVQINQPDAKDQLCLQIKDCMVDLRNQIDMYKVCAEDLETLLHSIVYLDNHPLTKKD